MEGIGLSEGKGELKRIEWSIVRRIIVLLPYNPRMKKTRIPMKSGLSYGKCVLYLAWMEMPGLIKREKDEEGFQVLSDAGLNLYRAQFMDEAALPANATL